MSQSLSVPSIRLPLWQERPRGVQCHPPTCVSGGGADRRKVTRCDLPHLLKLGQRLEAPADADVICSVQSGSLHPHSPTPPPHPQQPL